MAQSKLQTILQLRTLGPLLAGILICSVVSVCILFAHHKNWMLDTEDYIIEKEKEHLIRIATARGQYVGSILTDVSYNQAHDDLNFIRGLLQGYQQGKVKLKCHPGQDPNANDCTEDEKIADPQVVSIYEFNVDETNFEKTIYGFPSVSATVDFNSPYGIGLKLIDVFLRVLIESKRFEDEPEDMEQIGLILASQKLDYRYPARKIVENTDNYNPLMTDTYESLQEEYQQNELTVRVQSEGNQIILMLYSDFENQDGLSPEDALAAYLPADIFSRSFSSSDNYHYFVSHTSGNYVLAYDDTPLSELVGKKLEEVIFPDNSIMQKRMRTIINESQSSWDYTNSTSSSEEIVGPDMRYFLGIAPIEIRIADGKYESSLMCGAFINENDVMEDWYDSLAEIVDMIIIQMAVFLILLFLTILLAWLLSKTITRRIIEPIDRIEQFLRGKIDMQKLDKPYNQEVNKIIEYLKLLQTVEKFVNPRFLLHPDFDQRLENLKEAENLFDKIKNKRGRAIVQNLIGNIYFKQGQYTQATEYYQSAYDSIEELIDDVNHQEVNEESLAEKEKDLLLQKTGKQSSGWKDEKKFLEENLSERTLQLVMAKIADLDVRGQTENRWDLRAEWKEVSALLVQALQYYTKNKQNFVRVIKILIDIAYTYQQLEYSISAIELLDIINDEVRKLEPNKEEKSVDIDLTRLRRLGIDIQDDDEFRGKLYRIASITYQRDILLQQSLYRRGSILKDNGKYQEACLSFTMALVRYMQEQGEYYDLEIRNKCLQELRNIFRRHDLLKQSERLQYLYDTSIKDKPSILFIIAYDYVANTQLNQSVIKVTQTQLVGEEIEVNKTRFGAISNYILCQNELQIIERDYPLQDIEAFFEVSRSDWKRENVLDVIMRGYHMFPASNLEKTIVVFMQYDDCKGATVKEDLLLLAKEGFRLIIVQVAPINVELIRFIESQCGGHILQCYTSNEYKNAFKELAKLLG